MSSRIGIFGGTFNPVHNGHLKLAEGARKELLLDLVIWVPARIPPHKEVEEGAGAADRMKMVELVVKTLPGHELSKVEMEKSGSSYSIETVEALRRERSGDPEWFFLVGSDVAKSLPTWHRWEELRAMVQFVAIPRPGSHAPLPPGVREISVRTADLCASEIRRRIKENLSVEGMVPPAVLGYIKEKGLYR